MDGAAETRPASKIMKIVIRIVSFIVNIISKAVFIGFSMV